MIRMKSNINAIIQSRNGSTLVLDFPRSIYDLYEKLQSVGICQSPHRIPLSDEDGDDVRVKLYSESELGKHLLLTLSERNTLADANLLTFIVDNAREEIHPALEQSILGDQYDSMQEVVNAAKKMLYDSGPVKAVFYCPLVGSLLERDEDGDEYESPVDSRFLHGYCRERGRHRSIETHLQFQGQLSRFQSGPEPERSVNQMNMWPVIDMTATGRNIVRLRKQAGLSVRNLQDAFGFSNPQAIYKWQRGQAMPTLDNIVILAAVLGVGIDDIIVCNDPFQAKITA